MIYIYVYMDQLTTSICYYMLKQILDHEKDNINTEFVNAQINLNCMQFLADQWITAK